MTQRKFENAVFTTFAVIGLLGFGAGARADFGESDPAVNHAYGTLSHAYNSYFEKFLASPSKDMQSANALATEVIGPAEATMVHAMYDNATEIYAKAGVRTTTQVLKPRDLTVEHDLPDVGAEQPPKGADKVGFESNASRLPLSEVEKAARGLGGDATPYSQGGEPVVVDGSQFQKELTFPGGRKPAAAPARSR